MSLCAGCLAAFSLSMVFSGDTMLTLKLRTKGENIIIGMAMMMKRIAKLYQIVTKPLILEQNQPAPCLIIQESIYENNAD